MDSYIRNGRTKEYGQGTDEELEMFDHDHQGEVIVQHVEEGGKLVLGNMVLINQGNVGNVEPK